MRPPSILRAAHPRRLVLALVLLAWPLMLWGFGSMAHAQEAREGAPETIAEATEDKGRFLEFIENRLSTENRQIRVSGIEGALSSRVEIDLITVADRDGVWLRLESNVLDWSRRQLLRGRVEIEQLSSARIEVLRQPLPDPAAVPSPEASGGFAIPQLPLSIRVDALEVGELVLAEPLFGQAATLTIAGSAALADGGLDARLTATRLDGPGGRFALALGYDPDTERVAIDVDFSEPEGGIVATLAGLEGTPAVALSVAGEGPLDDLSVAIALDAGETRLLEGTVVLAGTPEGRRITADLDGAFGALLPASLRDFVGTASTLDLAALQREGGGLTVERFALDSGEVSLSGSARTAADGFLELLDLDAAIAASDGGRVTLPGGTSVAGADVRIDYGTGGGTGGDAGGEGAWSANATLRALDATAVMLEEAVISASGTLLNADDPEARGLTFALDGDLRGLSAPDEALAAALGRTVRLDATGAWQAGEPVRIETATLFAKAARVALAGVIRDLGLDGTIELDVASLAPFSGLAGRDLGGALALVAEGRVAPVGGAFDLALEGTANGLETGIAAVDGLVGDARLSGRLARDETGVTADGLSIDGRALDVLADGTLGSEAADLETRVAVLDLASVSDALSGEAVVTGRVTGADGAFDLDLTGRLAEGTLAGRSLRNVTLAFEGALARGDLRGRLDADATLDGQAVSLGGDLATLGPIREIRDLSFRAGAARLEGTVRQTADGLFEGDLSLAAPDVSTLAALALQEATGAVEATIRLATRGGAQLADVSARADDLAVGAARLGEAEIELALSDLFGVPAIDGRVEGSAIEAGGVRIDDLSIEAEGTAERSAIAGRATLNGDTEARLAGVLRPLAAAPAAPPADDAPDGAGTAGADAAARPGFALDLTQLALTRPGTAAPLALTLGAPTTVTVADGTVTLDDLLARVGGGTIRASGRAGDTLDLSLALDAVGLEAANAVRPDLDLAGTVSGEAEVSGTPADPRAAFSLSARDVVAAVLDAGDVAPVSLDLSGTFEEGTLRVPALSARNGDGLRIDGNAVVPLLGGAEAALMANLAVENLPLSLANAFREGLDASGRVGGLASLSGTLQAPEATFRVMVEEATAGPLREAGIEPLALAADGAFADRTLRLSELRVDNSQGVGLRASGVVPLVGGGLDLAVSIESLPLALADVAAPDLGLRGTVRGRADLRGTLREPRGGFTLEASELSAAPLRGAGIAPLDARLEGEALAEGVRLDTGRVANGQGLAVTVEGLLPKSADGTVDLAVSIESLPLALANAVRPDLGASGLLRGTASVSGRLPRPDARFDLSGERLTARPLAESGVEPLSLVAEGLLEGQVLTLRRARLANDQGIALDASGTVPLDGTGALDLDVVLDDVPLSIANAVRPDLDLAGTLAGRASVAGTLAAPEGTFDLEGRGVTAAPLRLNGVSPLDASIEGALVAGEPRVLRLAGARVTNAQGLLVTAEGTVPLSTDGALDIDVTLDALPLSIANAARPELALGGTASGTARIEGPLSAPEGAFDLAARDVTAAPLRQNGIAPVDVALRGDLEGETVRLEEARLTNPQGLLVTAGGTVPLSAEGPLDIDVTLDALPLSIADAARPDLDLSGTLSGTASVAGTLSAPVGTFEIDADRVSAAPLALNGVAPLDVEAEGSSDGRTLTLTRAAVSNAQGLRASASGTVPLDGAGEIDIDVAVEDAPLSIANAARPELDLSGRLSASARLSGPLSAPRGTFEIDGDRVSAAPLARAGVAPLDLAVTGTTDGRSVTLDEALVTNAQGVRVAASGTVPFSADGALDLDVRLERTPLSIAGAAAPDLALAGTVSGSARVTGTIGAPEGSFSIDGAGITAAPLRRNGVAPLNLSVSGASDGRRLRLTSASVTNGQGVSLTAAGTLPLSADGAIDVDVRLDALPLAIANAARPGLGLGGTISGDASVSGLARDPAVSFDLSGRGITANALRDNGVAPLALEARGAFENRAVRLARLDVANGQGVAVQASGRIPLDGPLAVQLQAAAPLSLGNRFLIDRGAQLGGTVQFSGSVTGPLSDPSINGLVSTQNASFVDPLANLRLSSIELLAGVSDNRVSFDRARATLASGGTVGLDGTVTIDPARGIPADLAIVLEGARYADGQIVAATVDGRITVTGPLTGAALIAGRIDVRRAEITIPEAFGASSDVLQVRHVMPPLDVVRTLARARIEEVAAGAAPVPRTRPDAPRLDILVSAPNQVFVRGRGLDAEVGGEVRVRGAITNVAPTGAFELIRGRLSILTKRITFERGTVTLVGDLDPFLDFRATTQSGDALVIITVTGRASDLSIEFSSEPDLPQDEVLARLIFGRGIDELSPLQIARLAAAAAELAGGGGGGLLSSLREATGLDDIDVTTDAQGNAAVRAGRYINDNVYLGVEAGAGGGRVTIDLDITDDLKARASAGPDESNIGLFFEKDF